MKFDYYHTCMFTSICIKSVNGTGADLKSVIAFIDYADHSIISWKETLHGLKALKRIGAIREKDKKLFLTIKSKNWWRKEYKRIGRMNMMKQIEEVDLYLSTNYAALRDRQPVEIELTKEDYTNALSEYIK